MFFLICLDDAIRQSNDSLPPFTNHSIHCSLITLPLIFSQINRSNIRNSQWWWKSTKTIDQFPFLIATEWPKVNHRSAVAINGTPTNGIFRLTLFNISFSFLLIFRMWLSYHLLIYAAIYIPGIIWFATVYCRYRRLAYHFERYFIVHKAYTHNVTRIHIYFPT